MALGRVAAVALDAGDGLACNIEVGWIGVRDFHSADQLAEQEASDATWPGWIVANHTPDHVGGVRFDAHQRALRGRSVLGRQRELDLEVLLRAHSQVRHNEHSNSRVVPCAERRWLPFTVGTRGAFGGLERARGDGVWHDAKELDLESALGRHQRQIALRWRESELGSAAAIEPQPADVARATAFAGDGGLLFVQRHAVIFVQPKVPIGAGKDAQLQLARIVEAESERLAFGLLVRLSVRSGTALDVGRVGEIHVDRARVDHWHDGTGGCEHRHLIHVAVKTVTTIAVVVVSSLKVEPTGAGVRGTRDELVNRVERTNVLGQVTKRSAWPWRLPSRLAQ